MGLRIFATFLAFAVLISTIASDDSEISTRVAKILSDNEATAIRYVGSYAGKLFFVDDSISSSWTVAKTFCLNAELRLASIGSVGENNYLKTVVTNSSNYYWTSGRDRITQNNFDWDDVSKPVDPSIGSFVFNGAHTYGIAFRGGTGGWSIFATSTGRYVLCQG